ncbi:MAG: RNA-directed DNA polymerase [Erysipelotrichia bacterium]|nr:RNA-directed DNA polymerase [Erysipelotrichia bacterium]
MNPELIKAFELAIDNIIKFGDTDVFPFPIESRIIFDKRSDVLKLLENIHTNFEHYIKYTPPQFENMLAPSGYTGFRWATQIDPIWNAYWLGLVLFLSDKIEDARLATDKDYVFSYRIQSNSLDKTLFDSDYGWHKFHEVSLDLASREEYGFVLICDISNFYQSVYHHRVENALSKLGNPAKEVEKNIMNILQQFSNMKSYGLPIGGQASRILAELVLNRTDRLLHSKQIRFCRFVDDYHIFAKTEEEVYLSYCL